MDLLTAIDLLSQRAEAELLAMLPDDASARCVLPSVGQGIVALSFVTAGCVLSGQLADCENFDDLVSAWRHFRSLWDAEVFDDATWSEVATDVFQEIELDVMRMSMQIGRDADREHRKRMAELN